MPVGFTSAASMRAPPVAAPEALPPEPPEHAATARRQLPTARPMPVRSDAAKCARDIVIEPSSSLSAWPRVTSGESVDT
jgi:hypothetical protein